MTTYVNCECVSLRARPPLPSSRLDPWPRARAPTSCNTFIIRPNFEQSIEGSGGRSIVYARARTLLKFGPLAAKTLRLYFWLESIILHGHIVQECARQHRPAPDQLAQIPAHRSEPTINIFGQQTGAADAGIKCDRETTAGGAR